MAEFKIHSIHLDGYSLPVPPGLEDLLNNGNGWGKKNVSRSGYSRKVIKRQGKLITVLKRGEKNAEKQNHSSAV